MIKIDSIIPSQNNFTKGFTMKSLLALSISVFSSALLAMPSVGDMAIYKIKTSGLEIIQKVELTSFNSSTNSFTKKETNSVMGQESTNIETVSADELNTELQLQGVLAYCESSQISGKIETVTVPAGTFKTCGLDTGEQGKANVAVVPFGVVKFINPSVSLELVEFKIAQ